MISISVWYHEHEQDSLRGFAWCLAWYCQYHARMAWIISETSNIYERSASCKCSTLLYIYSTMASFPKFQSIWSLSIRVKLSFLFQGYTHVFEMQMILIDCNNGFVKTALSHRTSMLLHCMGMKRTSCKTFRQEHDQSAAVMWVCVCLSLPWGSFYYKSVISAFYTSKHQCLSISNHSSSGFTNSTFWCTSWLISLMRTPCHAIALLGKLGFLDVCGQ